LRNVIIRRFETERAGAWAEPSNSDLGFNNGMVRIKQYMLSLRFFKKKFVHLVVSNKQNSSWVLLFGYNSADSAFLVEACFSAKNAFLLLPNFFGQSISCFINALSQQIPWWSHLHSSSDGEEANTVHMLTFLSASFHHMKLKQIIQLYILFLILYILILYIHVKKNFSKNCMLPSL